VGQDFYPAGRFAIGLIVLSSSSEKGRLEIGQQDEILPHAMKGSET
jgi:hypothetical protein